MRKVWKRGAAMALAAVMCAGALSGCGKKSESVSAFTFNGKKVDGGLANFILRYEQSSLDDVYAYYASMMQQDIWSMDDGQGLGITTWDNFKSQAGETIEKLLLAEEHASDYDVSLTDDEKKAITEAASKFISANEKDVLESMSATQEVVERYLTLCTIQSKVEKAMSADVDTNVSDDEAAQRTVSYIRYTPSTESQTEAESETEMAGTEADAENTVQTEPETETKMTAGASETAPETETKMAAAQSETEPETERKMTAAQSETEPETETKMTDKESEPETRAASSARILKDSMSSARSQAETDDESKSASAADKKKETGAKESRGSSETEKASKTRSADEKAQTEQAQAITEADSVQAVTEAEQAAAETEASAAQTEAEAESETEDPAMAEAREKYLRMAEDELESIKSGSEDFEAAAAKVTEEAVTGVTSSSFTFGKDDTYPDAAIIEATNDLEDGTLVGDVIKAGDDYYILYVKDAFDEDATDDKKEEIIKERRQEKIDEIYEKWISDEKFDIDSEKLAALVKDRSYTAPQSDETEPASPAEASTEASTESDTGVLMTEETELHLEVTYETEITVETESEKQE